MTRRTAVVIPVHNRRELTRQCLAALHAQSVDGFAVVVIDDGSTDGTSEMVATDFPEVVILAGDGNLWWSGGTNRGVEWALGHGFEWILTLNDDTVPDSCLIEALLECAAANPDALVGAAGVDARGQLLWGGTRMRWITASAQDLLVLEGESDDPVHEVTHLPGRGLLAPATCFRQVGLFDAARFPQAAADYDFTMRAGRAGWRLLIDYRARLMMMPEQGGGTQFRTSYSLANYGRHLFNRRGAGNLPMFWRFALVNSPRKYLIPYLVVGTVRRLLGYPLSWLRSLRRGT